MKRGIRFYETASGHRPVQEFLDSLTGKQAQKVTWTLTVIEELDVVPTSYLKKLPGTDEIWEIRVDFGGDTFRLLAFFDLDQFVILAHGFRKKTQKIPKKLLSLAEERRRDYLRRKSK